MAQKFVVRTGTGRFVKGVKSVVHRQGLKASDHVDDPAKARMFTLPMAQAVALRNGGKVVEVVREDAKTTAPRAAKAAAPKAEKDAAPKTERATAPKTVKAKTGRRKK